MFDVLRTHIEKFIKLSNDEWELLVPSLQTKKISKHGFFSKEGKICREIGFVVAGSMRHYYLKNGEEKTTYFYFENSLVTDYISCLTGTPGLLSIEALTDCSLIVFPYSALTMLYQKSHTWEKFGRMIAEYVAAGLEDRMTGLLLLSPEERYQQLLTGNKQKILERIPQHLIANYLGITPVSLSRIRNRTTRK